MIGAAYTSLGAQAIIGPAHAPTIPEVLWPGWMDTDLNLLGMVGEALSHDQFGPVENGVANIEAIDGGLAGAGWNIGGLALYDAEVGGLIIVVALVTPYEPEEGEVLTLGPGMLVFRFPDDGPLS